MKTFKKFPSKIMGLSIDEFNALVNTEDPQLINLQRTSLIPVLRTGDEGALAIANSDTLSNLIYLHLGGNRIKSEKAKLALRESKKLTHLKTLKVF